MEQEKTVRVLSIDGWNGPDGWSWNNWFHVGDVPIGLCDAKPRTLFRELRKLGFLSAASAGKVASEDDQYNIVIVDRVTREPLFALEYGAVL